MAAGVVLEKIKRESKPIQARLSSGPMPSINLNSFRQELLWLYIHAMAANPVAKTADHK